jgi:hypothetical protein
MLGLRLACLPFALAATLCAVPTGAQAQAAVDAPCRLCSATPDDSLNARAPSPLRLEVETRLDFDKVVFAGHGSALIALSPGGVARLSGAATAAGARAMPGSVLVRGEPGRAVTIALPARVILHGANAGSIVLDSLVTDLPAFPRIGDDGTLAFRFGGDLKLEGDSDGAYHGTIDISVDYL